MAPRLVSPSRGRQVRKVGIKNSCMGRTHWAGGGGGLPVEQTGFADRDLFILDEDTSRFGTVGARLILLVFKALALPGAALGGDAAARSPPACYKSFGEHTVVRKELSSGRCQERLGQYIQIAACLGLGQRATGRGIEAPPP